MLLYVQISFICSHFPSISPFHLGAPNSSYFSISHYISQLLCQRYPFPIGWPRFLIIFSRQEKIDLTMSLTSLCPYLPSAILKKKKKAAY